MPNQTVAIKADFDKVHLDRNFILFLVSKLPSYITIDKFFQTMNKMDLHLHNSKTSKSISITFVTIPQFASMLFSRPFEEFLKPATIEDCKISRCVPQPAKESK